jgi:uncharacterized membrane protein YbaN (DUF454 family)
MTHELPAGPRPLSTPARWLLQAVAGLCVLLGVIGLLVPVMPTVPFLIVAAWAASRSSPRLHRWLVTHPQFGGPLRDWNEHGIVPRRAKWFTGAMMAMSSVSMLVVAPAAWVPAVLVGIAGMAAVLAWLWRRPERRPDESGTP